MQAEMKILHWQTTSFAEHQAFGKFYETVDPLIDKLMETLMGKYGKVFIGGIDSLQVSDYNNLKINIFLMEMEAFYASEIWKCGLNPQADGEILNIVDEIRSELNVLKYLLTLK